MLLAHRRRRCFAPDARILALCREIQDQIGITRTIRTLECTWLQAPAVIGWLRPIMLLPVTALTGLSEAQLRAVIAHELAHIRRLDALVNLFQILVETLLFYHPAIWWLNNRIRAERELCCDEIAVSLSGDRIEYARAITLMAQWECPPALAMAANRGPLTMRILHILGRTSGSAGQRMIGLTGSILFFIAAIAAANALFVVAAPPIAQARESVKIGFEAALSTVSDRARQMFPAGAPAGNDTKSAAPKPEAVKEAPAEPLVPPSPGDLSQLVPKADLSTPTIVDPGSARSQPAAPNLQASLNSPASPAPFVFNCRNRNVYGWVVSSETIQMQGFICITSERTLNVTPTGVGNMGFSFGSCPSASEDPGLANLTTNSRLGASANRCKLDVTMNVQLADPADAAKMLPGKLVRLAGNFRVSRRNRVDYLSVANAKVIWTDPFDRPATAAQPASAAPANDQPTAAPIVLASINPVMQPGVHSCRNAKVFALVISPEEIQLPGFLCLPGDKENFLPVKFGSCPLASTVDLFDRQKDCRFDVIMKLQLADYNDAFKMKRRAIVRLSGDVRLTRDRQSNIQGATMENARLLQADSFSVAPSNFRCLPSELDAFARRIGQRLCVQNDILAKFKVTGTALEAAAMSPLRGPEVNGSAGDPEAITCRLPEDKKPAAHLRPLPLNCAYNSLWARMRDLPPMNPSMGVPTFSDMGGGISGNGNESTGIAQGGVIFH